jgi:hypothetical protein
MLIELLSELIMAESLWRAELQDHDLTEDMST